MLKRFGMGSVRKASGEWSVKPVVVLPALPFRLGRDVPFAALTVVPMSFPTVMQGHLPGNATQFQAKALRGRRQGTVMRDELGVRPTLSEELSR